MTLREVFDILVHADARLEHPPDLRRETKEKDYEDTCRAGCKDTGRRHGKL